ncbi:hypothetical protein B1207_01995 [Legionella quinlivanii]|uniref:DUF2845 domain-containing protein n=1 Tax=Legionella quinlivanii TaxID=45073 RepID=A0A364LNN1_9GAMM|nr:DUF2845 domain-containing protein [Legionella quinlivanii]RAP38674.1 hypothetical protein B1207_01995 [Legionella quinlivanii]
MAGRIAVAAVATVICPCILWAADSVYCPQNHGYINVGMTQDQVIAACGQPLSQQNSNKPLMQKIPAQQLYYNNEGAPTAFYGVWKLPIGNSNYGSAPFQGTAGGVQLQVDVVNNQVHDIVLNGNSTNAFSICGGTSIQAGDPVGKVYGACGSPSIVNNTFIEVPVQSQTKPQIWTYQPSQYGPPMSLTFVDGKLQSID